MKTDDIFPYLTGTWFHGDHQVRFGYAKTINRPDFKELSESLYKDPILDRLVKGNPDLTQGKETTRITHIGREFLIGAEYSF